VSSGDSQAITATETTNSSALPVRLGTNASSPCTSVTSLIDRLTA
jgi:hypothetical protein